MNPAGHWFWWALTGLCLLWYATVTLYVAVKGARDIRNMLRRLESINSEPAPGSSPEPAEEPGAGITH